MRVKALIKRIFIEIFRDKRTLAMLFVAPLLILSLMYLLFNSNTVNPKLGVVGIDGNIMKVLKKDDFDTVSYKSIKDGKETIKKDHLNALLIHQDNQWKLTLENSDPTTGKQIQAKINQIMISQVQMSVANSKFGINMLKNNLEVNYVYGNVDTKFFDVLSPILIGFFVFFFVFLISGIGLLKERTTGTLERILSTPIRRWQIVTAYLIGFGIFAVIQTTIVVFYAIQVLNMVLVGSIWNVILINLLLALVALSLGILLSSFASSEFQMVQFIPIVVVPQIFFSGLIPLDGMANWLQFIAKVMPLHYAATALKEVMYEGSTFHDIIGDVLALILFAALFIILNVFSLKKYRKL